MPGAPASSPAVDEATADVTRSTSTVATASMTALDSALERTQQMVLVLDLASRRITAVSRGLALAFPDIALVGTDATTYLVGGVSEAIQLLVTGRLDGYELSREVQFSQGVDDAHLWVHALGEARPPVKAVVVVDHKDALTDVLPTTSLDAHVMVVGTVDDEWRVDRLSADVDALTGAPSASLHGVSFLALVHPGDLGELLTGLGHLHSTGGGVAIRLRLRHRSDGWAWCRATLTALGERPAFGFVLVPLVTDSSPQEASLDLERRLARIAHEIHAVGGMRDLGGMPAMAELPDLARLTSREWDIVTRLRSGTRVDQISRDLHLSPSTVRNHLTTVYRKLGVPSQAELLVLLHKSAEETSGAPLRLS